MISSVVPVKFPVTRETPGNVFPKARLDGVVLLATAFSGLGSQVERRTRAAHSESLGSGEPGGNV